MTLTEELKKNVVVPAIKDDESFERVLKSKATVIFLLKSDLMTVENYVRRAHEYGKKILLHVDLTDGLGKDEAAVRYVARVIKPDGVITTKAAVVKCAVSEGLYTVFRAFLIDGQGLSSAKANVKKLSPDAVELMPGLLFDVVKEFLPLSKTIILGGLLRDEKSIKEALRVGATAVSCSDPTLWEVKNED